MNKIINLNQFNFRASFYKKYRKFLIFLDKKYRNTYTESIRNRIKQIFIQETFYPMLQISSESKIQDSLNFFNNSKIEFSNGLLINLQKKKILVSLFFRVKKISIAYTFLFLSVISVCKGFLKRNYNKNIKVNISISDLGLHQFYEIEELETLEMNINNRYFPLLQEADIIILKSVPFNGKRGKIIYFSNMPVFLLLSLINWSIFDLLHQVLSVLKFILINTVVALFDTKELFLFRDKAMLTVVNLLDKYRIINYYFLTNSDCFSHELFTLSRKNSNHKVAMLWYSMNNFEYNFKSDKISGYLPISYAPWMRTMNVDLHVVWNNEQKKMLKVLSRNSDFLVLGKPILFDNLLKQSHLETALGTLNIVIFDIPPKIETIERKYYSHSYVYVNRDTCLKFLEDILSLRERFSCNFFIKTKRKTDPSIDPEYLRFIRNSENLIQLEAKTSILSLFKEKIDLVICYPFTSVGYIAKKMGIPTIYYDPISIIEENVIYYEGQEIVSGKFSLEEYIVRNFSKQLDK